MYVYALLVQVTTILQVTNNFHIQQCMCIYINTYTRARACMCHVFTCVHMYLCMYAGHDNLAVTKNFDEARLCMCVQYYVCVCIIYGCCTCHGDNLASGNHF